MTIEPVLLLHVFALGVSAGLVLGAVLDWLSGVLVRAIGRWR